MRRGLSLIRGVLSHQGTVSIGVLQYQMYTQTQ